MLEIVFLGIVQGIAEFLPISSSGHLLILGAMIGEVSESPTQVIILHAGTLGSILVVYWRRILALLAKDKRVIPLLVIGTIPAAVVGLTIKANFKWIMELPELAAVMLVVTGVMLLVLGRLTPREGDYQSMSWWGALAIGCFQGLAVLPGISRSGSTILGGRLIGLKNEDSVTFSFLLAIPAILGATVLEIKDLITAPASAAAGSVPGFELITGAVVAFVVGIVALRWLIDWSREDRLHWFAWWCIPAGVIAVVLFRSGVV